MPAYECMECGSIEFTISKTSLGYWNSTCELCNTSRILSPNEQPPSQHEFCVNFSPRHIVETAEEYAFSIEDQASGSQFNKSKKDVVDFLRAADQETLEKIARSCAWDERIFNIYWEIVVDATKEEMLTQEVNKMLFSTKSEKSDPAAPAAES